MASTPISPLGIPPSDAGNAADATERIDRVVRTLEQLTHELRIIASELRVPLPPWVMGRGATDSIIRPDGSTPKLRSHILRLLGQWPSSLTTAEISNELYTVHPNLSLDLFKRRVIVTVSAMHKEKVPLVIPDAHRRGRGREIYWKLNPEFIPKPNDIYLDDDSSS